MKAAVADYKTRVHCLRIVPLWGAPIYLTEYVRDLTMGGHTYKTDSGYEFTGLAAEAKMAPGVVDLSGIANIAGIGFDQIVSGVFDNARVYLFATTWNNPVEDEEEIGVAFMGKITQLDNRYVAELMMMIDVLNQSVGESYCARCQKRFGGQEYAGCKMDLGPLTVTGTLTGVTSNSAFADSTRTEVDDWFGEGTIAFSTGANAGLKPQEIRSYTVDGAIVTHEAFHYPVEVGDAYTMIPGCRGRLEDCRDKWPTSNVVNFGGDTFIPTQSQYQDRGLR